MHTATATQATYLSDSLTVDVGCSSPTTTGVDKGLDVNFTLTLDGVDYEGEATLLPCADGRPGYESWGSVDHWLDGATLAALRKLDLDDSDFRAVLDRISSECASVCA